MLHILVPLALQAAPAPSEDERTVMVTGFDRLRVDGPFTVDIEPGPPGVVVTGDPAALDAVRVEVEARTLAINAGFHGAQSAIGKQAARAHIRVRVPALRVVQANGATLHIAELKGDRIDVSLNGDGRITVGAVDARDLGLTLVGAGGMTVAGKALRTRVQLYGTSSLDAGALTTGDAMLVSSSTGELAITVRYNAQIAAAGSGMVRALGQPRCVVQGDGPVDCSNIERRGQQ